MIGAISILTPRLSGPRGLNGGDESPDRLVARVGLAEDPDGLELVPLQPLSDPSPARGR